MTDIPLIAFNDGRSIPQMGFGAFHLDTSESEALVTQAIAAGYTAVDTAKVYKNEEGVGTAVRAAGRPIFVTSKLWRDDFGYDAALRGFDATMTRLGLETLDLYLLHWPFPKRDLYVDSWKALIRLKAEGRIRSIGVSNFLPEHLTRLVDETGVVPVNNQIEIHPHFQQRDVRAFNASQGITTTSWSPLGRGREIDDPVIVAIAGRTGKTPGQVILRWHIQHGLIVIPKTATPARMPENLGAFGFELGAEDMAAIDALDRADGRFGPDPADFDGSA